MPGCLCAPLALSWPAFCALAAVRAYAPLAIPVLDLAAICLIRSGSVEGLPDLGILAVLPVLWVTASRLSGPAILSISFFGPLLTGLPWLLNGGSTRTESRPPFSCHSSHWQLPLPCGFRGNS